MLGMSDKILIGYGELDIKYVGEVLTGYKGPDIRHEMRSPSKLKKIGYLAMIKS